MRIKVFFMTLVMALTTYFIRMLPTALFHRELQSKFAKSFFHYIPYAVLAAMTFPAVFYATGNLITALAGVAVAVIVSFLGGSLLVVSVLACLVAFLVGWIPF